MPVTPLLQSVLLCGLLVCLTAGECPCNTTATRRALEALYRSTNGPSWRRSDNWLQPSSSVCEWYGVDISCTRLSLSSNNLVGSLPAELSLLSNSSFAVLELCCNRLSGTLPPELSALTQLMSFIVSDNSLTGELPSAYGAWTSLQVFKAENNTITGTLPSSYSAWTSLKTFEVQVNRFGRTLPREYAMWTELEQFDVDTNNLSGTLPPEYGNWTRLTDMSFETNRISGSLPSSYNAWVLLRTFWGYKNELSGTLPLEYALWAGLNVFSVAFNRLSGTLPPEYRIWERIFLFRVDGNNITGPLPSSYSAWIAMEEFWAAKNRLQGTLPSMYALWLRVKFFEVGANNLSGPLPDVYSNWTSLVRFAAGENRLVGMLPVSYRAWSALVVFDVYANQLSGVLPHEYADWTDLAIFNVSDNNLSGTLPSAYHLWTSVDKFDASCNGLSGPLPAEYRMWSVVQVLLLSCNSLSGSIPPGYAQLKPSIFFLHSNRLSGSVPSLRVSLMLLLHNNVNLRGTLPYGMAHTIVATLCNTTLCGQLPLMWSGGLTRTVCKSYTAASSVDALLLAPVVPLPPCGCTAAPASNARINVTRVQASPTGAIQGVGTSAVLVASGGGGLLQVSLRSVAVAMRMSSCDSGNDVDVDDVVAVGVSIVDNPLRVSVPSNIPLTIGTVVGNAILLLCAPFVFVGSGHLLFRKRMEWEHWAAAGLLHVWGVLQVPTVAASVVLAVDVARDPTAACGVAATVGCLICTTAVLLAIAAWLRHVDGKRVQLPPLSAKRCSCMAYAACLLRRCFFLRSVWVLPSEAKNSERRGPRRLANGQALRPRDTHNRSVLIRVLDACRLQLFQGCHYPHRWLVVSDAVVGVVTGTLLGLTASAHVSCGVVRVAAWSVFAVVVVQTVIAAAARGRSTLADCAFDVLMCTWSAACALLAAFGVENGSEETAVAQAAFAAVWGLPRMALRITGTLSAARDSNGKAVVTRNDQEHDQRVLRRTSNAAVTRLEHARLPGMTSPAEMLEHLVRRICTARLGVVAAQRAQV